MKEKSRVERGSKKGKKRYEGRTGEQKASKRDWNPKEGSEDALSRYIHNSNAIGNWRVPR